MTYQNQGSCEIEEIRFLITSLQKYNLQHLVQAKFQKTSHVSNDWSWRYDAKYIFVIYL